MKYYKKNINNILILIGVILILISILYIPKYFFNKEGFKCNPPRSTRNSKCLCPKGQKWIGKKCVCIKGNIFNGQCIKCPPKEGINDNGECEECGLKERVNDDGKCEECPEDQYFKNGECYNCENAELYGDSPC